MIYQILINRLKRLLPQRLQPYSLICDVVWLSLKQRVLSGPFRGVWLARQAVGSYPLPRLLGTYELELHSTIASLVAEDFRLIINVGAGEGYYVSGLLRLFPRATCIAFETSIEGQALLRKVCTRNNLNTRVTIRGECEIDSLQACLNEKQPALVVIDVEGFESELLDPLRVPGLLNAVILVECHDFAVPGVTEAINAAMANTHLISKFVSQTRTINDFPECTLKRLRLIPQRYLLRMMQEGRPAPMTWLLIRPRALTR